MQNHFHLFGQKILNIGVKPTFLPIKKHQICNVNWGRVVASTFIVEEALNKMKGQIEVLSEEGKETVLFLYITNHQDVHLGKPYQTNVIISST